MTLIRSISGIRGTIGGFENESLTPVDVVKFTAAYAALIQKESGKSKIQIVIGRDARTSGTMISSLVRAALNSMGAEVIDCGLSTTPTVEMAVLFYRADGGIILTASHNPGEWNALKLLNSKGEFISAKQGEELLKIASEPIAFASVHQLGSCKMDDASLQKHIASIITLPYVNVEAITKANLRVAVDAINSSGAFAVPALLEALGVHNVHVINSEPNGIFAHNPEPLPEHLHELSEVVQEMDCDLGISIDPDVDRLALVCENGSMFGEEYTLVAVADYMLSIKKGNTVSNLSSSRALADITHKYGGDYFASAVGEVNVVAKMKEVNAVIGGEGNGGIIVPDLHYGRDALAGIAIFLTHFVLSGKKMSELKKSYPAYEMVKQKISLNESINVDAVLEHVKNHFQNEKITTVDGVKIDFEEGWVHLRKSNTEPIIRIYAEAANIDAAEKFASMIQDEVNKITGVIA